MPAHAPHPRIHVFLAALAPTVVAAVLVFTQAPKPLFVAVVGSSGLALAVWLVARERRRSRYIAQLAQQTRTQLRTPMEPISSLPLGSDRAALSEPNGAPLRTLNVPVFDASLPGGDDPSGPPDELALLSAMMHELRTRESEQLKALAKKSRNLEALIDALDEPVLATDNTDAVLLCNRSAEVFFGAASGSVTGRPITSLFTSEDILKMHAAARAGEVRRLRVRLTTPMGTRSFQVSASPVPAAWGDGIFGAVLILRDVTELDQAAIIKSDFVANASHELRTPVAAIRGAAETLEQCLTDDPASAGRFAGMIVQHASRLEDMLRDLLDLSRLESPDSTVATVPIDLSALWASVAPQFAPEAARKRLTLVFHADERTRGLRSDPGLLSLIVRNLVENAVKFAYEETTIRVSAVRSPLSTPQAAMIRIEVADRGIGIPLGLQDRVFERYFQVDSARTSASAKRGTGLGLSIVKHAAKRLGGQVGLTSVWHEGTTVWADIPEQPYSAHRSETPPFKHDTATEDKGKPGGNF